MKRVECEKFEDEIIDAPVGHGNALHGYCGPGKAKGTRLSARGVRTSQAAAEIELRVQARRRERLRRSYLEAA
jgi:hypothetical protein